jgi:SAM-dependent methyltransferase
MSDSMQVFNRRQVRRNRERAAARLDTHDFLFAEAAERLADRLDDIKRAFPLALDLGARGGVLARRLARRGGIETLVGADLSEAMARRGAASGNSPAVVADEEFLPFAGRAFDLVISNLDLHWVNDLPGALIQIRRALKPDGLFLASMFGGGTLAELRDALMAAEIELENGVSPRVSPFADVRDLGDLLQRAGFALPVVDAEEITVSFGSPLKLLADLRGMGETNAVIARRKQFTRRATMMAAMARYGEKYGAVDGRVPATFSVLTMTAWAPHPTQPKPLARGTGQVNLADVLGGRGED